MILSLALASLTAAADGRLVEFPANTDRQPAVILFISTVCPVSNDYHRRIEKLWTEFGRSTRFLVVYPNKTESLAEMQEHARVMRFPFPIYRDDNNELADAVGALVTPTAVVRTPDGRVVYLGPVDDAVNPARVKQQWLRNAIRATLAGRRVKPSDKPAYG